MTRHNVVTGSSTDDNETAGSTVSASFACFGTSGSFAGLVTAGLLGGTLVKVVALLPMAAALMTSARLCFSAAVRSRRSASQMLATVAG